MMKLYKKQAAGINNENGPDEAKRSAERDLARGAFHGTGDFLLVDEQRDGSIAIVAAYSVTTREVPQIVTEHVVTPREVKP